MQGWPGGQCKVAWGHVSAGTLALPALFWSPLAGRTLPERQQPLGTAVLVASPPPATVPHPRLTPQPSFPPPRSL